MAVGGDLSEQKQESFTLKELTGFFFSFENKQIVC